MGGVLGSDPGGREVGRDCDAAKLPGEGLLVDMGVTEHTRGQDLTVRGNDLPGIGVTSGRLGRDGIGSFGTPSLPRIRVAPG